MTWLWRSRRARLSLRPAGMEPCYQGRRGSVRYGEARVVPRGEVYGARGAMICGSVKA